MEDQTFLLPLDKEGWFHTKDMGDYHPKKGLRVMGRKDRLFISGGENIQPEEIERHLLNFPGITAARVTPTEDKEFGFRPVAFIRSSEPYEKRVLNEYLKGVLPSFKLPVEYLPFPLNLFH